MQNIIPLIVEGDTFPYPISVMIEMVKSVRSTKNIAMVLGHGYSFPKSFLLTSVSFVFNFCFKRATVSATSS